MIENASIMVQSIIQYYNLTLQKITLVEEDEYSVIFETANFIFKIYFDEKSTDKVVTLFNIEVKEHEDFVTSMKFDEYFIEENKFACFLTQTKLILSLIKPQFDE